MIGELPFGSEFRGRPWFERDSRHEKEPGAARKVVETLSGERAAEVKGKASARYERFAR